MKNLKKLKKKVENEYSNVYEQLEFIKEDVISEIKNETNLCYKEIKQEMKKLRVEQKIANQIEKLKKKLELIEMSFYGFSKHQLSEIINLNSIYEIRENIEINLSDNFGSRLSLFGFVILSLLVPFFILNEFKKNNKKIGDIFEGFKYKFEENKKRFLTSLDEKKEEIVGSITQFKEISKEEINFLQNNNFKTKYNKFIERIKSINE